MYRTSLKTPVGILQIFADNNGLSRIVFPALSAGIPAVTLAAKENDLLKKAATQLMEYFKGSRQTFDLPLSPRGTDFQCAVWKCMLDIPYGKTRTYGEIAVQLGNSNKARAVGGAANKNPLPLVIPCHRVIGSSGKLTGFTGGLALKQYLLDLERKKARTSAAADIRALLYPQPL
jgi:methylated-DNA-[protein]-cysteine S-methyltransferase